MPTYIAKQSIGHFRPGDEIKGLDAEHIQALLTSGAIAEPEEPKQAKTDDSGELKALKSEITELKAKCTAFESEKKLDADQITELKAKVEELEKAQSAEKPAAKPK